MYRVEYEERDGFTIKRSNLNGTVQITVSCGEYKISSTISSEMLTPENEIWIDAVITRYHKKLLHNELGIK